MKLITYLISIYIGYLTKVSLGLTGLCTLIMFFEKVIRTPGATYGQVGYYIGLSLIPTLSMLLPLASWLAILLTISELTLLHEWRTIRILGISTGQIIIPFFSLFCALATGLFLLDQSIGQNHLIKKNKYNLTVLKQIVPSSSQHKRDKKSKWLTLTNGEALITDGRITLYRPNKDHTSCIITEDHEIPAEQKQSIHKNSLHAHTAHSFSTSRSQVEQLTPALNCALLPLVTLLLFLGSGLSAPLSIPLLATVYPISLVIIALTSPLFPFCGHLLILLLSLWFYIKRETIK